MGALAATGLGIDVLVRGRRRLPRMRSYPARTAGSAHSFRSRPDLTPPAVSASGGGSGVSTGPNPQSRLLFLAPGPVNDAPIEQAGPLIVEADGEPVWFKPLLSGTVATNFSVSRYRGRPVLIWWQGQITSTGYGIGEGVIVDRSYREIARVRAANGRHMDLHEFRLTSRGTALLTCYPDVAEVDLSPIGGPKRGQVLAPVIQEVDVDSGRLLLEWRSIEHVPIADSYRPPADPFDYLHVNSVAPTMDGNLLVSGRHTWSLYKLERRTGRLLWRLGGKRSQFQMGAGSQFSWQHDARQVADGLLTVLDNGSDGYVNTAARSRALLLDLDERWAAVRVARAYTTPTPLLAASMGSVQLLPAGRVIVGWGSASHTSEFTAGGGLIADAALPTGLFSYRGLLLPWQGRPDHAPAIAPERQRRTGAKLIYASWNGSTEVASWRVKVGGSAHAMRPIGVARRRAFETVIPLHPAVAYASVTALDHAGRPLGDSRTVRV